MTAVLLFAVLFPTAFAKTDPDAIDDVRKIIANGPYYNRNAYPNQELGKYKPSTHR